MKNIIFFFLLFISASSIAQPEISFVTPNNVFRGQTANIFISATNTHFQQGVTNINLGTDITVVSVTVNSSLTLTVLINVSSTAALGNRPISINTSSETVVLDDAIEVMEESSNLSATISVIPTDAIYLSDFDPGNLQNAPTLFSVTLRNDNQLRDVKVKFILTGEGITTGEIVTAIKNFPSLTPMSVEVFNNNKFDEYKINAESSFINQTLQSGLLPAGTYYYKIMVIDANGATIASDESINVITNNTTGINLISPGNDFSENPEIITTEYPFFQWLSTANSFDFFLYKAESGQITADEIINNIPLFEQKDITVTSFMYRNYAPILEKGQTYIWKVNAYVTTGKGKQTILSDIFRFTLQSINSTNLTLANIVVEPEQKTLKIGETFQFKAIGYDINNDTASIACQWSVIPSDLGKINSTGIFTAGKYPKTIAVIANYKGLQAYATVTIEWSESNYIEEHFFDIENLFNSVFGLNKK
ncbi:MAG: hypothetical protein HGB12_13120 [Bacteroidetes bacterium]|nr:hypothetical protein [Bacteroidota bacterium]